jgi:2-(1,2-epoxy-1,2-dihydrophenyl)acetyl-CoA isomerase
MGWVKQLIAHGLDQSMAEILEAEASFQELAGETVDASDAMAAFLEKRTPKFIGK